MMTGETRELPDGAVVGVVVTRHRRELLADSLKIIAAQTPARKSPSQSATRAIGSQSALRPADTLAAAKGFEVWR